MDNWIRFPLDRHAEAIAAKLLPGDGVSIKVQVFDPTTMAVLDRTLEATLLLYDRHGFTARDNAGTLHCCRWQEAFAWCKRHEC